MHAVDVLILVFYGLGMLAVGMYFHRRQTDLEEYFVGGRSLGAAHIGLSVVKLVKVEGAVVNIENVDVLDGTPLLDIKPYVPAFDEPESVRTGWLGDARRRVAEKRADGRFA